MISLKIGGIVVAAFIAGALIASPELRAYAANTVGSSDIIDESILSQDIKNGEVKINDLGGNSVTSAKIKDSEVKAADIAPDAVGASEIAGVTKLLFGQCSTSELVGTGASGGATLTATCTLNGADTDDSVIAVLNGAANFCYHVEQAWVESDDNVKVTVSSDCATAVTITSGSSLAIIVYDK